MATIQLLKTAKTKTHLLIIADKWKNHSDYVLTAQEVGYLDTYFKDADKKVTFLTL